MADATTPTADPNDRNVQGSIQENYLDEYWVGKTAADKTINWLYLGDGITTVTPKYTDKKKSAAYYNGGGQERQTVTGVTSSYDISGDRSIGNRGAAMTNKVDLSPLVTRLNNLNVLTNRLADVIVRDSDQYVPFLNGYLAGHVSRIQTGTGVTIVWTVPSPAYMYGGKVMVKAPDTMGQRRGYHKVVTNRPLNYNHTKHALAQKGWVDKAYLVNGHNWAALVAHGDVIVRDSDQYVPFLNGYLAGHVSRIQTGTGVTIH
ncbi:hypothetical protein WP50_20415 [Lactiplantibacillus plantarum]|nr:hypothetical protein WP50_20415 [Lactiplantibacillus plantarum]